MLAEFKQKVVGFVSRHPKALALVGAGSVMAAKVAAVTIDLNATLGPILDGIAALVPSIVNLIIALLPLAIIMVAVMIVYALGDMIVGIFSNMMHSFGGHRGKKK